MAHALLTTWSDMKERLERVIRSVDDMINDIIAEKLADREVANMLCDEKMSPLVLPPSTYPSSPPPYPTPDPTPEPTPEPPAPIAAPEIVVGPHIVVADSPRVPSPDPTTEEEVPTPEVPRLWRSKRKHDRYDPVKKPKCAIFVDIPQPTHCIRMAGGVIRGSECVICHLCWKDERLIPTEYFKS